MNRFQISIQKPKERFTEYIYRNGYEIIRACFIYRQIRRGPHIKEHHHTFRRYSNTPRRRNYEWRSMHGSHKKEPWNTCKICDKKGCHSSLYRNSGKQLYKRFAEAYLNGLYDHGSGKDAIAAFLDAEEKQINSHTDSYIIFSRAVAAMGMLPKDSKRLVDRAVIDTGSNFISFAKRWLLAAARTANKRDVKSDMKTNERR